MVNSIFCRYKLYLEVKKENEILKKEIEKMKEDLKRCENFLSPKMVLTMDDYDNENFKDKLEDNIKKWKDVMKKNEYEYMERWLGLEVAIYE